MSDTRRSGRERKQANSFYEDAKREIESIASLR